MSDSVFESLSLKTGKILDDSTIIAYPTYEIHLIRTELGTYLLKKYTADLRKKYSTEKEYELYHLLNHGVPKFFPKPEFHFQADGLLVFEADTNLSYETFDKLLKKNRAKNATILELGRLIGKLHKYLDEIDTKNNLVDTHDNHPFQVLSDFGNIDAIIESLPPDYNTQKQPIIGTKNIGRALVANGQPVAFLEPKSFQLGSPMEDVGNVLAFLILHSSTSGATRK